jgi:hypothetical protein
MAHLAMIGSMSTVPCTSRYLEGDMSDTVWVAGSATF